MTTPLEPRKRLTRRALLTRGAVILGVGATTGAGLAFSPLGARFYSQFGVLGDDTCTGRAPAIPDAAQGWTLSPSNPVLNVEDAPAWDDVGVYDAAVVRREDGTLWMWYSTREQRPWSIAMALDTTGTGDHWTRLSDNPVLQPTPAESLPYHVISRPSVVSTASGWHMWYSAVADDNAWIGTAFSLDGTHWTKHGSPVLAPASAWEGQAVLCPNVIYDSSARCFKMWYSGGDLYEPDAIGYATSPDGIGWTPDAGNPIFRPTSGWEDYKVGSFQVRKVGSWYYAFYNAFQHNPFVSRIGMARSRDGITQWEHHPANPILSPGMPCTWSGAMVYKPTALWNDAKQRWDVWFNASDRLGGDERIGHAWSNSVW